MSGTLHYGDNLEVMRGISDASVDLIYLDPPFNSQRNYNLIHKGSEAQEQAFKDTWTWDNEAQLAFESIAGSERAAGVPVELTEVMRAIRSLLGRDMDTLAYLSMMAVRLVEMRRLLRSTGSIYLHCDPTASHFLRVIMDAVFGADRFANEIVWRRTNARTAVDRWPKVHDTILFYRMSSSTSFSQLQVQADKAKLPHTLVTGADGLRYQTYELTAPNVRHGETGKPWRGFQPAKYGRCWANPPSVMDAWDKQGRIYWPKKPGAWPRRIADKPFAPEDRLVTVGDVWTDIDRLNQSAKERIGYPTQKPVALLERIVKASTSAGDLVLDPFCGCGTTIEAAERLGRKWIGIDVALRAIDTIKERLDKVFPVQVWVEKGEPFDLESAERLAETNPYDFQWWAVRQLGGRPPKGEKKKGADGGIDGELFLRDFDTETQRRALISAKGGRSLTPGMVKELESTMRLEKADYGILVTMHPPTKGMKELAAGFGIVRGPAGERRLRYRVTIVTAAELLNQSFALPGINVTPRSKSVPPPPEPRKGDTLPLPFGTAPAKKPPSDKLVKARTRPSEEAAPTKKKARGGR